MMVLTWSTLLWTGLAVAQQEPPCTQAEGQVFSGGHLAKSPAQTDDAEVSAFGADSRAQCWAPVPCSGGVEYSPIVYSTNSGLFWTTVATDITPGQYAYFNLVEDSWYEWTLCSADGASAPYDSVLSLRSQDDQMGHCYSDDFCEDDAKISWLPPSSRIVRVLITESSQGLCNSDVSLNTTLRWRRLLTPPDPVCPNGVCEATESDCNCPADCEPECGDGCCTGTETQCTCWQDCNQACGDGCCINESSCYCPEDCGPPSGPDCNTNSVPDGCDLLYGTSHDVNHNFVPDECEGLGPPAQVTTWVSRRSNPRPPGCCDTDLRDGQTEGHVGGVTELRIGFDMPPGGPGDNPVTLEQRTCAAPWFAAYDGNSALSAAVTGNELVLTFTPGLENARTYRMTIGPGVSSLGGQQVYARVLVGDVAWDGLVDGIDRSTIVSAWTSLGGFTCRTDVNNDGVTNSTDRSIVVGAWTSTARCAP